jgi:hypothetical protein
MRAFYPSVAGGFRNGGFRGSFKGSGSHVALTAMAHAVMALTAGR